MSKFLLLLGPSGVGKSTLIRELRHLDNRFTYISPYTTRKLREGETDKVSVSDQTLDEMAACGEFLIINEIYGIRYGTPRLPIIEALGTGKFPVLDWPISRIDIMTKAFPGKLYTIYVAPPSIEALRERLAKDGRDADGSRLRGAVEELEAFQAGKFEDSYDFNIVTHTDRVSEIARSIYSKYLEGLDSPGCKTKERI
jgi:guanylate kinase